MSQLICDLEAHNHDRNVHRFYRMWVSTNLFKIMLVCVQYGRAGTHGRVKEYVVANAQEANALIRSILKKRGGAFKRLGVAYSAPRVVSGGHCVDQGPLGKAE